VEWVQGIESDIGETIQVNRSAQSQARRISLDGPMIVCLLHSALASRALFWFFRGTVACEARFLRLCSAADLNSL